MRVTHVYKDCYPPVQGGIEKHIHSIRSGPSRHEHSILACARAPRGHARATPWGGERLVAEYGRVLSTPMAPGFIAATGGSDADLMHFHTPNPLGELAALLAVDRPYVATYHSDVVRQAFLLPAYARLLAAFLRRARAVVVASEGLRFSSRHLRDVEQVVVIPYGVDTDRYRRETVPPEAVTKLRSLYGEVFVLAVGRLVYYKGFDVLIDAANEVGAPVVIVGEGPLRSRLEAHRDALGLGDTVRFVGSVSEDDLLAHYAAASAFVLPSTERAEAFGVATVEAQAFGLPVVVTELGTGTTEAMIPGESGLVVTPGDSAALAQALRRILAGNDALDMSRAARDFTLRRLSRDAMSAKLDRLYDAVLER